MILDDTLTSTNLSSLELPSCLSGVIYDIYHIFDACRREYGQNCILIALDHSDVVYSIILCEISRRSLISFSALPFW